METAELKSAPFHNEAHSDVLFDEDYRAHIEKLNAMLNRERAEVIQLRLENRRMRSQIEAFKSAPPRRLVNGNRVFVLAR